MRYVACAALFLLPLAAQQQVRFSGEVRAGGLEFRKDIGHDLVFIVAPVGGAPGVGWMIQIRPEAAASAVSDYPNYIGCVTPPYHGPNPADIMAWLALDPNRPDWLGPGSPARDRQFQFTLNAEDNRKACQELDSEEHIPPKKDPKTGDLVFGDPQYKPPTLGTGHLWIRTFDPGGGRDVQTARLLWLSFDAEVVFPRNAPGK